MQKRTTLIGGILSLLLLKQPLLIKNIIVFLNVLSLLFLFEKVYAESVDFYNTRENKQELSENHYEFILRDLGKSREALLNDYYEEISEYKKEMEFYERISEYTKAIEVNPNNAVAYYNRGIFKRKLKDYYGAISDYTKAIEINPKYAKAYNNRGFAKGRSNDYYGAISDFTKAIEINPKYALAFANRGSSKKSIGDMLGACDDWGKASSFGHEDASKSVSNQC